MRSWKGPELERAAKVRLHERFRIHFGTRLGLANAKFALKDLPLIKSQDLKKHSLKRCSKEEMPDAYETSLKPKKDSW